MYERFMPNNFVDLYLHYLILLDTYESDFEVLILRRGLLARP